MLRFLAEGYTNQVIADRLIVTVETVEPHRARTLGKLGLRKRTERVRHAETYGLLGAGAEHLA